MTDLQSASREELLAIIESLLTRVAVLEEENRRLRGGKGGGTPLAIKPSRPPKEKRKRKRRDRAFVRRREPADEEVRHAAEQCPDCGDKLRGGWEHGRRQVIEVVLQRWVVDHILWARRCGRCGTRVLPKLETVDLGVQGKRRLGASVQSLVATLHIGYRMPIRRIGEFLRETCGVHVGNGEVVKLLDGLKQAGGLELTRLKARVRGSPSVCGDETGWRQDGENGYIWGFFTEGERYFEYRKSRAGQVPEEILGEDFTGVVTCDFYAGYNKVGVLQRCWFHLLKDAKELAKLNADTASVVTWVAALQALYRQAKVCCEALKESPADSRARRQERRRLEGLAVQLAQPYAQDPRRLSGYSPRESSSIGTNCSCL